jgi:UDP-N-acetylmuramyl pentapeptide phosphotransferase/UDP-N-acetylglucosamine-1-phosphate transferase
MIRQAIALAALMTWLGCLGLILLARRHRFGLDETRGELQKKHREPTPRTGGIALTGGWVVGAVLISLAGYSPEHFNTRVGLAALPLLAAGVWEDLRRHLAPWVRAIATVLSAALAVALCGVSVTHLDVTGLDSVLRTVPWLGWVIATIAIGAMPHAVNMIDGFHGLAGTVGAMILAAIAYVAFKVGDTQIMSLAGVGFGALVGFLFWNWPRGQIFLGDTGAYLLGFAVAVLAVLLVQRNPQVTPWFAVLVLIYPTWELLFSLYRRRMVRKRPGMRADSLHLHHLIYRRLTRALHLENPGHSRTSLNAYTAPYLWGLAAFSIGPAILWWNSTSLLAGFTFLFVLAYSLAYRSLMR